LIPASRIVLDTGPLGKISHPRPNREIANWLESLLRHGVMVYVPEIADYEVRRELFRAGLHESINRLDGLKKVLNHLPINTDVMLKAAELWAWARNHGIPTADPKALDADVILAAHDEAGKVQSTKVLRDGPPFTTAALEATQDWRFAPATLNGTPVESKTVLVFCFRPPASYWP
jgi:predicted nucleic acid-binding protein